MSDITTIGKTNWRNEHTPFGIRDNDRMYHIYSIGKSGVGKSTLLLNMAISDINRGNGIAVLDPHSDLSLKLLNHIPAKRIKDVIYFNPAAEYVVPFNPLANIPKGQYHLAVSGLIATFRKIFSESWGPRLEHILRFSLLTLLEYGTATLLDVQPLLSNKDFREAILNQISNTQVINFWRNEFDKYTPQLRAEAIAPILNKMGLFQASAPLRSTVGQRAMTWNIQDVMDNRKIFIANLSKGELGEDASSLLGSMLINAFQLQALSRTKQPEEYRIPFYLYIDEAHSFLTLAFSDLLAESRKFKLSLFLTHQYLEQLHEKVRAAIFGNVGTLICFRLGADDAEYLESEFYPIFSKDDFINLPRHHIYLKLMIDGASSKPFSAITLPLEKQTDAPEENIIKNSQHKYSKPDAISDVITTIPAQSLEPPTLF